MGRRSYENIYHPPVDSKAARKVLLRSRPHGTHTEMPEELPMGNFPIFNGRLVNLCVTTIGQSYQLEQGLLTPRESIRLFPLLMQWTASNTGNAMSHLG